MIGHACRLAAERLIEFDKNNIRSQCYWVKSFALLNSTAGKYQFGSTVTFILYFYRLFVVVSDGSGIKGKLLVLFARARIVPIYSNRRSVELKTE